MKTIRIFLILLFFVPINLIEIYGQRSIRGRIIDDCLESVMGALIVNNNTGLGQADFNGFFDIIVPEGTNKLGFVQLGYEFANIEISENCNYIEIILLPDAHYDFMSNRKIDRLRKKEFNTLPQLHLNVVKKGIFTSEVICYYRKFEPVKPKLDEISKQIKIRKRQIKKDYQKLSIGDTIQIPFGVNAGYDGMSNTTLFLWSSMTDTKDFDCVIEGIVIKKHRNRYKLYNPDLVSKGRGYNFIYRVTDCENCKYNSIVYRGKAMKIGQEFEHNMKIYKMIIKNNNASR